MSNAPHAPPIQDDRNHLTLPNAQINFLESSQHPLGLTSRGGICEIQLRFLGACQGPAIRDREGKDVDVG